MGRRLFATLLAFVLLTLVAGCPGPTFIVQQYRGDPRPADTIAILRVNGSDSVRLLILDDEDVAAPIESDGRLHIEMLPAKHVLLVGNAKAPHERYLPISWQAEPGKVYRVMFAAQSGDGGAGARIYEVDRGKDAVVRDVTISTPTAPDAPRRKQPVEPPPPPPLPPSSPPSDGDDAGSNAGSNDGAPTSSSTQ